MRIAARSIPNGTARSATIRESEEVVWIVVPRTAARNTGRTEAVQAPGLACEARQRRRYIPPTPWMHRVALPAPVVFGGNARKNGDDTPKKNVARLRRAALGCDSEQPPCSRRKR